MALAHIMSGSTPIVKWVSMPSVESITRERLRAPIAYDVAPSVGAEHFDDLFGDEVGSGQERVVTCVQVDRAGSPVRMEALQGEGGAAILHADEIRRGSALPCRPARRCPEGAYRLRGQAVPRPGAGLLVCQGLPEAVAERGGGVAGNADRAIVARRHPDRVLLAAHDVGLRLPDVWQVRGDVDQMTSGRVVLGTTPATQIEPPP